MYKIGVLNGDYIGPEAMKEALKILKACSEKYGFAYETVMLEASGEAYDKYGEHLPQITLDKAGECDALLKGPFGGPPKELNHPKWMGVEKEAILPLRKKFGLHTNLRHIRVFNSCLEFSPVKEKISKDVDILIVRELVSGIYFGEKGEKIRDNERVCYDVEEYGESEIRRVAVRAFEFARKRKKKVTLIGKSNVLKTSVLWREIVSEVSRDYHDVTCDYLHVDNASIQLILNPKQFDVILTTNMFGDILSDEASVLSGSLGLYASTSIGDTSFGLYEPIHGSAPDIAGKDIVNPISSILCVAQMMRYSLGLEHIAEDIENAVDTVLKQGYRTKDLYMEERGHVLLGTCAMGDKICECIRMKEE